MLDKLKTAIVLVVIGALSGFLIYGANELTSDLIAANRIAREQAYYLEIFNKTEDFEMADPVITNMEGLIVQEIVISDIEGNPLGYIYKGSEKNNYGDITVLVGIDIEGKITNVIISSTTNTPTFVKKITENFLSPFSEQEAAAVEYDSSTGASFTYGSVSKIVEQATAYFTTNRGVTND